MPDLDKAAKDPSTPSAAYAAMLPVWTKVSTLLSGTEAMRSAGTKYLPQHENETSASYEDRLASNVLLNRTEQTLDSWVGRPFSDPVQVNEELSEEMQEWLKNVDLQGNELHVFARQWFETGLSHAFSHVLVDFPTVDRSPGRSLADDVAEGVRPYFVEVLPENLIFADSTVVDGREILTHLRIMEESTVRVGFAQVVERRIRVFDRILPMDMGPEQLVQFFPVESQDPEIMMDLLERNEPAVFVSVWKFNPQAKGEIEWDLEQPPRRIEIDEIPLVTFYADRQGLMLGKPPIEDLSDLNIRWWQSNADQINVLTVARFPILSGTGVDEEQGDVLEVGPKRMLTATNEKAKFGYVEHTGAAIEAGRQDLSDLDEAMCDYGAEFLKERPNSPTATARALDSAEATSPLQDAAIRFNDALQKALELMGRWSSQEVVEAAASVPTEFGPEKIVPGDVQMVQFARDRGDLSREMFLKEMQRRAALSDEFDMEENARQLERERTEFDGEPTDNEDIDPFQADEDEDEPDNS